MPLKSSKFHDARRIGVPTILAVATAQVFAQSSPQGNTTGAGPDAIQTIVITEGMVIGILSWLISIFISIPITNVLCYGVGMAILTAPMPPVFGATGILAWLIFTIVLGTLASALPARRASRLTVRDTLAYE